MSIWQSVLDMGFCIHFVQIAHSGLQRGMAHASDLLDKLNGIQADVAHVQAQAHRLALQAR